MILKKKESFLLIFLILLQSCSGGRIGNFLESSFNDLEKTSQDEDLQNNLKNKKVVIEKNEQISDKNYKKTIKEKKLKTEQENKKISEKNYQKRLKEKKLESLQENKEINDENLEKTQKQKNNKNKTSSKKRKIDLQSYKIIFILKDVDPKDPTEELNTILRNSEVNFEIEKIERILDSKIKYE